MNLGLRLALWALVMTIIAAPSRAAAQGLPFEKPADPANTDIYLVTVDIGYDIASRFGHSFLRIIDHNTGRQYNFNWGVFDFDEENFAYKFYRGTLKYWVALQSWPRIVDIYRYTKQSVIQDKLNLTAKQKQILFDRIAWNAQPENIEYKYHHFYNNCSTKIRDYIDEALGGKLSDGIGPQMTGRSYRDHVRESMDGLWWADIGIEITTNSLFDLQLDKWNEMFLPEYLREHLVNHPAIDDEGNEIPGLTLLSNPQPVVEMPPVPGGFSPTVTFGFVFCGLFLIAIVRYTMQRGQGKVSKGVLRLSGLAFLLFGFWSGLFGITMVLNWTVSGHTDLYHNANLWLFFPTDWLFAWLGSVLLVRGRLGPMVICKRLGSLFSRLHVIGVLVCLVLWLSGEIDQDVSHILAAFGPAIVMMSFLWQIIALDADRQDEATA